MYQLFSCSIPIHSSRPEEDALALKTVCQKENNVVKSTVVQIISSSSGKPEETTSTLSFGWLVVRGRRPHSNCVSSNRLQQLSQSVCIGVTLFPSNYNLPPSVGIIYPIATYIFHSHIFPKLLAGYIQYKIVHYPTLCPKGTKKPFQFTIILQVLP